MAKQDPEVIFKVQRYNPEKEAIPHLKEYRIPTKRGMTILDGLIYIRENLDSTLAFRTSCRMGICGSCGMLINNYPHLACHTQIEEFRTLTITVRPLPNSSIIKDLVVDLMPMFNRHKSLAPYIIRQDKEEMANPSREYRQLPGEVESYEQFSYCVKCGICVAACPTAASDPQFLGPQVLGQCYRYCADSRDSGSHERLGKAEANHGAWRCHLAGACSEACPKGVDPALAIQLLKRKMAIQSLVGGKKKEPADLYPAPTEIKPRVPFPDFTAKK
jgi:succinate dehydrogenase / fumarate reductase, iron-sulfur subunit